MATEDTAASADAIRRMAQIITQKFNLPVASAAVERAKRIFDEMVAPQQLARRQAETLAGDMLQAQHKLEQKLALAEAEAGILRAENIRLQEELATLKNLAVGAIS